MSERSMAIGEKDLEKIGEYVEAKLPEWLERVSQESGKQWLFNADRALFERVVTIENQLKGIEQRMDERFEQMCTDMNTRFEDMNKRFTSTQWLVGIMVTVFMALNTAIQLL